MSSYHKILGVSNLASKADIKKAYRSKAMEVHPDVNDSPEAQKLFIELADAYEALFNDNYKTDIKESKRKYWDTYQPPSDENEYEKWKKVDEERREFYKEQARKTAERSKQVFKNEVSNFRKSLIFYPSLIFYYIVLFLFIICPIVSLCVPVYIILNPLEFNFTNDLIIIMTICIVVICYTLFKGLVHIKKVIDPYFFG